MKVFMLPNKKHYRTEKSEGGIRRVVEAYEKYLPEFGVEVVHNPEASYDLLASHAGWTGGMCDVSHVHGLYWTNDYQMGKWADNANRKVIDECRKAKLITVPSNWVAETFQRDMRINPIVLNHGIDWEAWEHNEESRNYVLWNKNRAMDVCDPTPVVELAKRHKQQLFLTTFATKNMPSEMTNVKVTGIVSHAKMKNYIQQAGVYLATTKETFGIGTLEAMAAGLPILGFDWGGTKDIVQHNVNGYLAKPGNFDDLADGLVFCLKHREVLGNNSKRLVQNFGWLKIIEQLYGIYQLCGQPEPATVGITIPCYNKEDVIARAIASVKNQTFSDFKCVIVDDGSSDNSVVKVKELIQDDKRFSIITKTNSGVADTRNTGVRSLDTKYSVCLDADDALEPTYLEVCRNALEKDREINIAYTKLRSVMPDGATGISKWPDKWDFSMNVLGKNQIPTCCMYRKSMWEALGGYKSKYCPQGAGTEDANFWLRAGVHGYKAELVTEEPLFIYYQNVGITSKKGYKEIDWFREYPWYKDQSYPCFSYSQPKNKIAHSVRQYDQPIVSVVIPVGPNHVQHLPDALDSLENQLERQWEAIVINDSGEKFDELLFKSYPYIRYFETEGARGAGYARNLGAKKARANFLLFLDVDDWLEPDCLSLMLEDWSLENAVIYSDYFGISFIEDVNKLADYQRARIKARNEKTFETKMVYVARDYKWEMLKTKPMPIHLDGKDKGHPYDWCIMSALIPKAWHEKIGGFDEDLFSWEDLEYWWRMGKAGYCFHKIKKPLVTYRFHTGRRRDKGIRSYDKLIKYLQDKHKNLEVDEMACSSCGRKRISGKTLLAQVVRTPQTASTAYSDQDVVMCEYVTTRGGSHTVIGGVTKTNYRSRQRGDKFYVFKVDIEAQPHLFRPLLTRPEAPETDNKIDLVPKPL